MIPFYEPYSALVYAANARDVRTTIVHGRVVMDDTCERLMNSKDIQEFYLGAKEEGARGERRWKKKKTWR